MKTWKILQVVGVLTLLVGVVVRVGGEYYGTAIALLGVLVYAIARVTTWVKSDRP